MFENFSPHATCAQRPSGACCRTSARRVRTARRADHRRAGVPGTRHVWFTLRARANAGGAVEKSTGTCSADFAIRGGAAWMHGLTFTPNTPPKPACVLKSNDQVEPRDRGRQPATGLGRRHDHDIRSRCAVPGALGAAASALAQSAFYPSRPISWWCPTPLAGIADLLARIVGEAVGNVTATVVIDNRQGPAGTSAGVGRQCTGRRLHACCHHRAQRAAKLTRTSLRPGR